MKAEKTVMGVHAPPGRPTIRAALTIACILSLPFAALAAVELAFF
jgi:hypothetical protein